MIIHKCSRPAPKFAGQVTRMVSERDGPGHFKNELKIENTLAPIPYLGLTQDRDGSWRCA